MSASRTARERVRAELTREITDSARRQLAEAGATGLSLRAIAREMDMVSSAIHRYFPTKDDLLTALIIDGYNSVGDAVERADEGQGRDDVFGRWLAVAHAVREWGIAHPHEYALIYGSPVPGYRAPQDTVVAAIRDTTVFGAIISEAYQMGALAPGVPPPVPASFAEDAARVRAVMPGVPDDVVAAAITMWTGVYGWVSFELFGQFNTVIEDRKGAFDHHVRCLAALIGLRA